MKLINRQGIEFFVNDDTNDEVQNFWTIDSWEYNNYIIVKDFANTCSTFLNAGGWIGPFTLFAAKIYQQVYSLEPDPIAFEELSKNVELNRFTNVHLTNKALFDESKTEIEMGSDYSPLGRSGTSVFQKKESIRVPCITLKKYFSQNNIPIHSFFMLDVEGAEYILFDDVEFFDSYKPIVLVELHLKFLNDDNFNHLIKGLKNLNHLYQIEISPIISKRNDIIHCLFLPN